MKVVPPPARLEAVTVPPWRSTMAFTIDRPRPLPVACAGAGRIHLVEPIEHVRQMLGCDARSGVADGHDDRAVLERRVQRRRCRLSACGAARSRPDSAAPARAAWDRRSRFRRRARCSSSMLDAFLFGRAAVAREHASEQILERHILRVERLAAAFEARQIQQIADDVLDALRLVANDRRDSARAFRDRATARAARAFRDSRACR